MKALYYPDWGKLELAELTEPSAGQGEVVVRVAACGICGSELETFASRSLRRTPPLVMGHEFCGYVESGETSGFSAGSRVVCNALIHCGACEHCNQGRTNLCRRRGIFGMNRPGAFAERVAVPESTLMVWPDELPATWASLAEPLGNGVHVVGRIRDRNPESVLVIGAGSIGLMVLQAVKALLDTPVVVVDLDRTRLGVAKALGASETVESSAKGLENLTECHPGGFDVVVDAAGTGPTKVLSMQHCRDDGLVVWIGLGGDNVALPTYPLTLRELTVTGSYGATHGDMTEAIRLMTSGLVDLDSWVTSYPLDAAVDAFLRQMDPARRDIKAVIHMGSEAAA